MSEENNTYEIDPNWTPITIEDLADGTGTNLAEAIDQINQMGTQLAGLVRKAELWDSVSSGLLTQVLSANSDDHTTNPNDYLNSEWVEFEVVIPTKNKYTPVGIIGYSVSNIAYQIYSCKIENGCVKFGVDTRSGKTFGSIGMTGGVHVTTIILYARDPIVT